MVSDSKQEYNDPKLWRKLYTIGCDEVETKYDDLHET